MDIYILIFLILGLCMGSFYNVVGYRLPKKESIIKPSSYCPKCKHKLTPIELMPLISYIIQRGKCKKCKKKIPIFYPLIELVTGLLFVLSYLMFGLSWDLLISLCFVSTLLIIIVSDINYMIIPDEILIIGILLILIIKLLTGGNIIEIILDMIIPFIILYLIKLFGDFIFQRESLGGGDIKLMLIFGLVVGWSLALFSVFLASFIALPIAIIILKLKKTDIIPFGPFLNLAVLMIYFSKMEILWLIDFLIK